MKLDVSRVTTLATIVLVLAGYFAVFRPFETTLAARSADIDGVLDEVDRARIAGRESRQAERDVRVLRRALRDAHLEDEPAMQLARFLRSVAGVAREHHVRVTALGTTAPLAPLANATSAPSAGPILEDIPATLSLRGAYSDVLAVASAMSSSPLAARWSIDGLAPAKSRNDHATAVLATFTVDFLHQKSSPDHVAL